MFTKGRNFKRMDKKFYKIRGPTCNSISAWEAGTSLYFARSFEVVSSGFMSNDLVVLLEMVEEHIVWSWEPVKPVLMEHLFCPSHDYAFQIFKSYYSDSVVLGTEYFLCKY